MWWNLGAARCSRVSSCAWRGEVSVCATVAFEDRAFTGRSLINALWRWGLFFYDNLKENREGKLTSAVSYGLQKYCSYVALLKLLVPPSLSLIPGMWALQTEDETAPSVPPFCFLSSTVSFGESWYAQSYSPPIVVACGISSDRALSRTGSMACFLPACSGTEPSKVQSLVKVLTSERGLIFWTRVVTLSFHDCFLWQLCAV